MRLRKNILNKKSQGLVFGFFLFCIGFYLVTYSYISNKRQEIFDEMNMKVYEKQTEVVKTEEIEVPEIDSVDSSLEEETTVDIADDGVVAPTYKDSANYIGTISISKIQLKAGFVSMNSKENDVDKHVAIMPTSTYPDVPLGNFILAAHSGRGKIAYFNDLYRLGVGDMVEIEYQGTTYQYQIVNIYEEQKTGKIAIYRDYNKTTLTLIACTNNNSKTQTVYIAERINE